MTDLLSLITPTNFLVEQDKFLNSSSYNPIFHYIWREIDIKPKFSIKLKYPVWEAVSHQDHKLITSSASTLFQVNLNKDDLVYAQNVAATKGKFSKGTSLEYAKLLRGALDYFSLDDVAVELSDESGFNSRPKHKENKVIVSKHIHFEYFSMEAGVNHELVHVLRYRNGVHNQLKRSQNFLPTEEGLASWCQDHTNSDNGEAQHAMEYVGSDIGRQGSLRDIFDYMVSQGMSRELAWKRAARHKFGFVDTGRPGDIMKPAMYFASERRVGVLETVEKLRLFVGKISLDELKDYPKYTGIWPAQKLIDYFKL